MINPQAFKMTTKYLILCIICWITVVSIKTTLIYLGYSESLIVWLLHKTSILIGILSVWFLFDHFHFFSKVEISKTSYYFLFRYSFFLYVFHEPVLTILQKALYFLLGQTELISFLIYISAPVITVISSIFVASYFRRLAPKSYYMLTGEREFKIKYVVLYTIRLTLKKST